MSDEIVQTFEAAGFVIQEQGILPLSSFIPEHPSLASITDYSSWHTGTVTDPWLWRDRFAGEGIAAYGRFFAKKPMFIADSLFPLVKCALGAEDSIERRYRDGLISHNTVKLYRAIEEQDGIDVRALRKITGLQHKDDKNEFDRALIELQSSFHVVILGVSERLNAAGLKSGWNSTCYILAERWMELFELPIFDGTKDEAKQVLNTFLHSQWNAAAYQYMLKIIAKY
ncbi:AlkZ-related protein [Paenibacillus psychroresistens]|nr:hypothetical protein [Paenibacillus psychroresistens]